MKFWHSIFVLLTIFFLAASTYSQQLINKTINVNGVNRQYLVYLPVKFNSSESLPALFHYHGGGGNSQEALQYEIDYRSLANSQRFIAVYPQASVDPNGCTCWDGLGPYWQGIDEVAFANAMADAMIDEYNVNPNRLYASGYSLGGSLMYELFCYVGDRFAAVAPIAANMWEWTQDACDSAPPTALLHILGTNDFYAPYNGNQYSLSTSAQNTFVANINGALTTPIESPYQNNVTEVLYPQGKNCHTVMHYRRQGGGHDIPSFAGNAIWSYVSQFDINGLIGCGTTNTCPTDLNNDGLTNIFDLLELISAYGTSDENSDLNDDSIVNAIDLLNVVSQLGTTCN